MGNFFIPTMSDQQIKLVQTGALAVLAIAALGYVFQYAQSVERTFPSKTFSVDGTADVETTPDVATFSVSVISEGGTDVTNLQNQNTEKMKAVSQFMKDRGVKEKDLKTRDYTLTPRYNNPVCQQGVCPPATIVGYTISQSLDVKVRDVTQVGDLLAGAVAAGGNSVSDIKFVLDDDTDAKNDARGKAIKKAKEKAKAIALAGGFRLGKIISLYETNNDPLPYGGGMGGGVEMSSLKAATNVAPVLEPGVTTSTVTISMTYEIVN